jgi:hypothetical protein
MSSESFWFFGGGGLRTGLVGVGTGVFLTRVMRGNSPTICLWGRQIVATLTSGTLLGVAVAQV